MPRVAANGIELCWESLGEGPPLVLIMGIGAQLVHWPDGFCEQLAARGFRVVRFDNRDTGLSTKLDGQPVPRLSSLLPRALLGLRIDAPYTLEDMAADVVGLLDALDIERAHIVGASLGGMIAQMMAIEHGSRVQTLTSVMSSTGSWASTVGRPSAIRVLLRRPPRSRDEAMDFAVTFFRTVGSPGFDFDEDAIRQRAAVAYDRCFYPPGFGRQLAAALATGDRTKALAGVQAKTLVIHGSEDPLIRPVFGMATARAIPGARLRLIEGMGHDLPEGAWPIVAEAIASHALA